jgi:DeoR family suf operon transcriptional repressor
MAEGPVTAGSDHRRSHPDEPRAPGLAAFPPTRRALLVALKRLGEARAETLAGEIGITVGGVRQHLGSLEADGLVGHREIKGGPGRPKFAYRLTPTAEALFPRSYSELTNELLEYLGEAEGTPVERAFARRAARRLADARPRLEGTFEQRVAALAATLDDDGYVAGFERLPDGSFRITEHNCAILGVARRHSVACSSELEFLRAALPDAEISRVSHIVSGAFACSYLVRPDGPGPRSGS